jgi:hypothetical protein
MSMHCGPPGQRTDLPHTARLLQHDVPVPPLDAASTRTSTSDHGLPADQCNRGGIKVGLEVRPIASVTLSDGRGPAERALTQGFCAGLLRVGSAAAGSRMGAVIRACCFIAGTSLPAAMFREGFAM